MHWMVSITVQIVPPVSATVVCRFLISTLENSFYFSRICELAWTADMEDELQISGLCVCIPRLWNKFLHVISALTANCACDRECELQWEWKWCCGKEKKDSDREGTTELKSNLAPKMRKWCSARGHCTSSDTTSTAADPPQNFSWTIVGVLHTLTYTYLFIYTCL